MDTKKNSEERYEKRTTKKSANTLNATEPGATQKKTTGRRRRRRLSPSMTSEVRDRHRHDSPQAKNAECHAFCVCVDVPSLKRQKRSISLIQKQGDASSGICSNGLWSDLLCFHELGS